MERTETIVINLAEHKDWEGQEFLIHVDLAEQQAEFVFQKKEDKK